MSHGLTQMMPLRRRPAPPSADSYGDSFVAETDEEVVGRTARGFDTHAGGWVWALHPGTSGAVTANFIVDAAFNGVDAPASGALMAWADTIDLGSPDQWLEIESIQANAYTFGPVLRVNPTTYDAYGIDLAGSVRIVRVVDGAGSFNILDTGFDVVDGDLIRFEVNGTTLRAQVNGGTWAETTHSAFTAGNHFGFYKQNARPTTYRRVRYGAL